MHDFIFQQVSSTHLKFLDYKENTKLNHGILSLNTIFVLKCFDLKK